MKDNTIKVPTQNTVKKDLPKPIIQNPPKRVEKVVKPKIEPKYNDFKTFAVKIGFTLDRVSQDTFIGIPRISDIRVIALDSVGVP